MNISTFLSLSLFGLNTVLCHKRKPILGTVILTDKCNLHCKHCSVNNHLATIAPYSQIKHEMEQLYAMGIRILFFAVVKHFFGRTAKRVFETLLSKQKLWDFSL